MNNNTSTYLSKSLFMKGLQCHKLLYLEKYHPELKAETPDEAERRFEFGHEVGKYAQRLFPEGIEIPHTELSYSEQVERTRIEIEKGSEIIYEAAFVYDKVFARADILKKTNEGWHVYEVKGSTELKDLYIDDSAIQYYVLNGCIQVSGIFVVHLNNEYVKNGDIEVEKLFTIVDVTDKVREKQEAVKEELKRQRDMLNGNMPVIDIGKHCDEPYECAYWHHCWRHIPEDSVFGLRGKGVNKYELYRNGILKLADIPLDILNNSQRIQVAAFINKSEIINKQAVKDFLDSLWYPIYFLDFETFKTPIPVFDRTWPYVDIPFQYSLHYLTKEDAELKHDEYLAYPGKDFREELLLRLLNTIPDDACVLAYNSAYEKKVLNYLIEQFPECKTRINSIINNMADLAAPFRAKDVYTYKMNGSYSLKTVLPVMIPELGYEGLEISDGGMASEAYFEMCETNDPDELEKIRKALLQYCRLDTLAMVRILEKLREIVESIEDKCRQDFINDY